MFGKKKSKDTEVRLETASAPQPSMAAVTRPCVSCSASCRPDASGLYRCSFCGMEFTQDDIVEKPKPVTKPTPQAVTVQSVTPERSAEDIYSMNQNGVVEIITECGRASGFIISKKGFVLTNAHAILNQKGEVCSRIFVKFGQDSIPAQTVAVGDVDGNNAENVDLALLLMEKVPEGASNLHLGNSANVRIGQHVYYIGNSKGEGLCMTAGIISDNNRRVQNRYYIMTDAATNPGNSGGPLFNEDGYVIGVHVSARVEADGMKYAIPVDTARAFLNVVEDKLGVAHNTLAQDSLVPLTNTEISTGAIVTLVLTGVTVLAANIGFIKDLIEAFA